MVFSGLFQRLSGMLGGKRPPPTDGDSDERDATEGLPNAKLMKLSPDQNKLLKQELEAIQNNVTAQIENLGHKYQSIEEREKDREEEIRNLKDLLYEGSLQVKRQKIKNGCLVEKNQELLGLLKEAEKSMEESMRQTAQLLEVTRAKLRHETENSRQTENKDIQNPTLSDSQTEKVTSVQKPSTSLDTASATSLSVDHASLIPTNPDVVTSPETVQSKSDGLTSGPEVASSSIDKETTPPSPLEDKPTPTPTTTESNEEESKSEEKPTSSKSEIAKDEKVAKENEMSEPIDESLRLSALSGLDVQVKFIRENILFPLANKEALLASGVRFMKGTVFHGQSGTGQVEVAKCLTAELSRLTGQTFSFFRRFKTDVFSKYSADASPFVNKLFDSAIAKAPAVILIEDIETLIPHCSILGYSAYESLLSDIRKQLDRIEAGRVFVIVTSSELSKVPAVLIRHGRLEKSLAFPPPSQAFRIGILRRGTKQWKIKPSDEVIENVSAKTSDLSVDELEQLCRAAFVAALTRQFASVSKAETYKLNSETADSLEVLEEDWNSAAETMEKLKKGTKKVTSIEKLLAMKPESIDGDVIDAKLGFSSVGGLDEQLKDIRENVLFPLVNKEALVEWGVEPVKGIIFHGPPGTGKTLLAKALAAELSRLTEAPFTFFYRKGTDSIQKYVGWTESYLKELFDKAKTSKPAIIFFDEIDGLCSKRQDVSSSGSNFYNGIVTNMLGHLDNIKRGEVLVIAATNRLDSLDPAFTRPGRFDKSIAFFPPKEIGRKAILGIHSSQWKRGQDEKILEEIAKQTEGYTGADLEQVCRQTFLCAIRRQFPSCTSDKVTPSELENFDVLLEDWYSALSTVKGSNTNVFGNSVCTGKAVTPAISKLISGIEKEILEKLMPFLNGPLSLVEKGSGIKSFLIWDSGVRGVRVIDNLVIPSLVGCEELKETRTFTLGQHMIDNSSLKSLMSQVLTCQKTALLYIPRIDRIQDKFAREDTNSKNFFLEQLESLRGENVILLGTANCSVEDLPEEFRPLFKGLSGTGSRSYKMRKFEKQERREFFAQILEKFPALLDRVEDLTETANIYDILDLKAEMSQACATAKETEKEGEVAQSLKTILDNYAENRLDSCGPRNNMYS